MSWLSRLLGTEYRPPPAPAVRIEPAMVAAGEIKQNVVDGINSLAFPQPMLFAALGGYGSNTGVPVTQLTALQAAAVYGCVKCISEDIAGLGVQIRRRLPGGGWVIAEHHPLNRLLRHPNRMQTAFQFWSYVLTAYCLRGNAYIVVQRDGTGAPVELMPVSPDRTTPTVAPDGMLWYRVNARAVGDSVVVPPHDMIHLKNMSLDGYIGLSPIACAQDVIGLALAAQQHGAVLFRQGGQVGGVIKHPGRIGKEATDNIAASWRDTHTGVQNAHKVMVLEEGMTFEKIAMTSEDAQLLECLAPGTLITLGNGARMPVEAIRQGETIMAWDGGPVASRVAAVGRPPRKPMVRITTHRGRVLTCTSDHPCLGLRALRTAGGRQALDDPKWIAAGELTQGNYLRVALGHTTEDRGELEPSIAWLLGFLTGNGYIREGSSSFSTDDRAVVELASTAINSLGGQAIKSETRLWDYNVHTGGVGRGGSSLRALFRNSGLEGSHAHNKRVPGIVFWDGPTSWAWFLSGYLDADGTVTHPGVRQPAVSWSSVSRDLLDGCQHLLALLGIQSGIYLASPEATRMMPTGQISPARATWGLTVNGNTMLGRLANALHPCHSRRAPRLAGFANLAASRYRPANWLYDRVKTVEHIGDGETYGIEIEGTHTHVTNGLVTHNTRRFQVTDICRLFRVPPHKLGELGRATYSNIEVSNRSYIDDCLHSHTDQLQGLLDEHLLFDDERDDYSTHWDFTGMLRGDTAQRYAAYQVGLLNGFLSRNEVRALENLNPIPGGDEYRVPLNTADPLHPETIGQRIPTDNEGDDETGDGDAV